MVQFVSSEISGFIRVESGLLSDSLIWCASHGNSFFLVKLLAGIITKPQGTFMGFKKKFSSALMSLALVTAGAVVGAAPANAGTSIGATYNGASHIYYKFYASTNTFCIKKKNWSSSYRATVKFYKTGPEAAHIQTNKRNTWACKVLSDYQNIHEGDYLRFTLSMHHHDYPTYKKSSGFVRL